MPVVTSILPEVAKTIRGLAIDGVQKAGTGHMGTALGCAELGAYLFGHFLRIHPKVPKWENRDRFVLSAGHASLLLYAGLHLCKFPITKKDLGRYRQWGSNTPSHPDIRRTVGVEATTGVDGQGIGYGVGIALAKKLHHAHLDYKTIVLAGDGCFMEGISSEASSLAGHLNLDDLIVIYDSNETSLDGYVVETFSEDIKSRYISYGWDVEEIDGHDLNAIDTLFTQLRTTQTKPMLIIANTQIGRGIEKRAGLFEVHNGCIDSDQAEQAKQHQFQFYTPEDVSVHFEAKNAAIYKLYQPSTPILEPQINFALPSLPRKAKGREISHQMLQLASTNNPKIYAGSADCARSDKTFIQNSPFISQNSFEGKNIKFGVREFGMGAIAAGLALSGLRPVIGTFLAFSDYMTSAIRMIALMNLKVIFHFSHDSFLIGEDGPTHQPVEHLAALRGVPNLTVIRPADHKEIYAAWNIALKASGPTAIVVPRQEITQLDTTCAKSVAKGAYIVKSSPNSQVRIFATGSELELALTISKSFDATVVSVPSWELFDQQSSNYKNDILGKDHELKVSIEAASAMGWERFISTKGISISLNTFGDSGTPEELKQAFGFTTEKIIHRIKDGL